MTEKLVTEAEARSELAEAIERAGSIRALARETGVTHSAIAAANSGEDLRPQILTMLGLEEYQRVYIRIRKGTK